MKVSLRILMPFASLLAFAGPAVAHEVWMERDGAGPARLYLADLALDVQESDETARLKGSTVFTADPAKPAVLTQRDGHFEAPVSGKGDVRARNDNVFAPWTDGGVRNGKIYHARVGRTETAAKMDFELVPVASGSDSFTLLFRGKPHPKTDVIVFSPSRWHKTVKTDDAGRLTVPSQGAGRYILVADISEDAARQMGGETVARVHHQTTLSYMD
jgi:hypothetical protein